INYLKRTFPDVAFKGELLEGKEFEDTIEEYDKKNEVDIIAMITYPKGFWDKLLKRSVTRKMAFHSRIPVLAIPAK
ncbi:MAG TPA: universal stress protein, partial [Chitinophagaceae bacterium]|nr:universal stress protein [Chitinophagaceae bacterium]